LAADIENKYSVKSKLIASSHGVFEVVVDEKLIFSKKDLGRFPEHTEIMESIDSLED